MSCNCKFTAKAEKDSDEIIRYISVDLQNKTAAQKLLEKIFQQIELLKRFPFSGTIVENELIRQEVRKIVIDNYIGYYKIDADTNDLYVLRIAYAKQDLDAMLRQLF